jgi:hypothetical protein
MIFFILGMMTAPLYAVVMGLTALKIPQAPLALSNFSFIACLIGTALVLGMQAVKMHGEKRTISSMQEKA